MHRHIVTQTVPRLILGALLVFFPVAGFPLGLGKLQVKSALNEPLNAEIDITAAAEHELKGLNVSLAPRADFDAVGAERLPLLSQIKFIVSKRPDGRYYLQLKTDSPIEEPFLHVLLQLEWPGGRLVREYTALIDPPSYIVGKPPVTEAPQTAVPTPEPNTKFVETVPPPGPEAEKVPDQAAAPVAPAEPMAAAAAPPQPAEVNPVPPSAAAQEEAPQQVVVAPVEQPAEQSTAQTAPVQPPAATSSPMTGSASVTEYTVRPGDTVWAIADRMRADKQLTMEQVMIAIFRNNKDAFFRDNVNNLRAGKVLKLPEREAIDATPRNEALREFRAQYDAWQEYKLKLAAGSSTLKVAESKPPESKPEPAAAKTDTAKKTEAPAEKAAQAKQSSQELLKVVRGAADAEKAAAGKSAETESAKDVEKRERTALAERVTTLEESLQSKQLENRELTEKVGQVRSQIKNEKRLIELESQALAQQTAKPAVAPEPKPAPAPKAETPADKPVTPPAAAATDAKPATPEIKKEPAPAPAKPVKAAPKRHPVAPPPPPPEKGFLASLYDDLIGDSLLPIVGGIVALAGGVILIVYMRRRRRSIAEFEESILASDAIPSDATAPTGTAETTGQVTTGDTSFLSDFSKSGMGQVHTDEVDPIAEAEVYLAYGRDETAEEILKEAIVKNPDRQELKQKLLEIYHQRNDANAFETLAEELYAALGGRGGKVWEKVEEMGRKLNPENPMFRGGAPGRRAADKGERPVAQGMQSVSLSAAGVAGAGAGTIAATQATQVVTSSSSVDFDFDASSKPRGAVSASESANSALDFDLNVPDVASDVSIDEKPASRPASADLSELESIDFGSTNENVVDFDSNKADAAIPDTAVADVAIEAAPAAADDDIRWDMDAPVAAAAAAESVDADAAGNGNGADGQWDETATKLDLAKAYIDMGDAEGARSILDEVLAEGNEQQKKQAAELAAQIA